MFSTAINRAWSSWSCEFNKKLTDVLDEVGAENGEMRCIAVCSVVGLHLVQILPNIRQKNFPLS